MDRRLFCGSNPLISVMMIDGLNIHIMNGGRTMSEQRIKHMVIFNLKYEAGTEQANQFLTKSKAILEAIPRVEKFEVFRQISGKNDYDFGFSMEFADQSAYDGYNTHQDHVDYVNNIWKNEVVRFLEIDFRR
jgi:hypothetical protein